MLFDLKFVPQKGKEISRQFKIWSRIRYDQVLPVIEHNLFNDKTEIFVIGSCFANEIRAVLQGAGIKVHPEIDPALGELFPEALKVSPSWGVWDERVHYQCYTPFSIEQEINQALGFWQAEEDAILESTKDGRTLYWDPYRRAVYAHSREDILKIRGIMNDRIREGLEKADAIVMTLGLVEAHKVKEFSGYAAEMNTAFMDRLEFVNMSYQQAFEAIDSVCRNIKATFPDKKIIISVSPIPLMRTFTKMDVVTATMRAKSILRTVADEVAARYDHVYYWPSYEYVMWSGRGFREDDIRHVTPEIVTEITSAFCGSFFTKKIVEAVELEASGNAGGSYKGLRLKVLLRKSLNIARRKVFS